MLYLNTNAETPLSYNVSQGRVDSVIVESLGMNESFAELKAIEPGNFSSPVWIAENPSGIDSKDELRVYIIYILKLQNQHMTVTENFILNNYLWDSFKIQ